MGGPNARTTYKPRARRPSPPFFQLLNLNVNHVLLSSNLQTSTAFTNWRPSPPFFQLINVNLFCLQNQAVWGVPRPPTPLYGKSAFIAPKKHEQGPKMAFFAWNKGQKSFFEQNSLSGSKMRWIWEVPSERKTMTPPLRQYRVRDINIFTLHYMYQKFVYCS